MKHHGSILLEVLLAIALFAFAGVVVLATVDEALADGARGARRAVAMDMARSRLAQLEAGEDSSAGAPTGTEATGTAVTGSAATGTAATLGANAGLRLEFKLDPTDFPGLALATVEVYDDAAVIGIAARLAATSTADPPRLAVLRQLVRSAFQGEGAARPEFGQ